MKNWAILYTVLLSMHASTVSAEVISGMIGHWAFDEGSGTAAHDTSGTGNDGVVSGSAGWSSSGKYGSALSLAGGGGDYVQVASPLNLPLGNSARSIAAWVKWSGTELPGVPPYGGSFRYQTILAYGSPGDYYTPSLQNHLFGLERGGAASSPYYKHLFSTGWNNDFAGTATDALPADTWTHVAVTFDGSTVTLYLNGVIDGSASKTYDTVLNSFGLLIGDTPPNDGWHENFSGLIDDVYVYDRALSQSDVQQLMAGESAVPEPSALIVWSLLGATGMTVRWWRRKRDG